MSTKAAAAGKILQPFCNAARKIEARSAHKLQTVSPVIAQAVAEHNANGTDAAAASTGRYVKEQKQLFHYRVVRFFDECRYLGSGEYFRGYDVKKFVWDLRFCTKVLILFIVGTLVGRKSIFPPIDPDSPLAMALDHKDNPNY